jgi:hypothetical protein
VTDLERQLHALAADVAWPPTPDLGPAVLAAPGRRPRQAPRRRLLAAAVAALVLVPAAGAAAFPDARDDVLEWLGLRNVGVRRVPAPPPADPVGARGRPRPRAEPRRGRARGGLQGSDPRHAGEARPRPDRGRPLSLVYAPRAGLPALDGVDAGLILTQSPGGIHGAYLDKMLLGGTDAERVSVDGHRGVFISGGEHAYLYETPDGEVREDRPLLAGPTLIWQAGGFVFRMESRAGRVDAVRIGASTRP